MLDKYLRTLLIPSGIKLQHCHPRGNPSPIPSPRLSLQLHEVEVAFLQKSPKRKHKPFRR